jgi:hypothetical protein
MVLRQEGVVHTHDKKLEEGTVIADMYKVVKSKALGGTGSFVGTYCYVCEDVSISEQLDEEVVRRCLAAPGKLQEKLRIEVASLCAGRSADWSGLEHVLGEEQSRRFFGQQPRSWWVQLLEAVTRARDLAEAGGEPLRAAHVLRELLPPSPLRKDAERPRVFIKTFKKYDRQTVAEIRRCSAKAPDFSRDRLQASAALMPPPPQHFFGIYHRVQVENKAMRSRTGRWEWAT